MNWYVLHVLTGSELEVQRQLREKGLDALVVQETAVIRRGGKWHEQIMTVFPGYVFVFMKYTVDAHYIIKNVTGAIRLLPKDGPQPLPPKESAWLLEGFGQMLIPSKIDFGGETPRILDGPLLEWENYITKIDRHRRRVLLCIPIFSEDKEITLSFLPV